MANFFDWLKQATGQQYSQNTQHFSDLSDQQIQKFYDDKANANLNAYNEYGTPLGIKTMRNGDASWADQNSYKADDAFTHDAKTAPGNPTVYEFSYVAPANAEDIDGGGYVRKKGAVLLTPDWNGATSSSGKGSVDRNGDLRGNNLVYEAILEDGTTLTADQFQDFIAGNNAYFSTHGSPVNFNASEPLYVGERNSPSRQEALDYYNNLRKSYRESADLPAPYQPSVYWDTSKRRWMVNR